MTEVAASRTSHDTVAARLATAREALQAAYALIRNDTEDNLSPGEVLNQVRGTQGLVDLAHGIQTHRLAQHAGTVTRHDPLGLGDSAARGSAPTADRVDPRRFADLGAILQWGPRTAARRCREAVTAVTELPCLVDSLADGEIDRERLAAVVDATHDLSEDDRRTAAPLVE